MVDRAETLVWRLGRLAAQIRLQPRIQGGGAGLADLVVVGGQVVISEWRCPRENAASAQELRAGRKITERGAALSRVVGQADQQTVHNVHRTVPGIIVGHGQIGTLIQGDIFHLRADVVGCMQKRAKVHREHIIGVEVAVADGKGRGAVKEFAIPGLTPIVRKDRLARISKAQVLYRGAACVQSGRSVMPRGGTRASGDCLPH